jgi:hypothetical protein
LLARAGDEAKIGFKVHPHMLRHACGYALANKCRAAPRGGSGPLMWARASGPVMFSSAIP